MHIAMWSGPRNISTAMMRSFENRADMCVMDEPFYAYYLAHADAVHPMHEEIIAAGETDWTRVVAQCRAKPQTPNRHGFVPRHVFQKHITTHFLPQIDLTWTRDIAHFFLIRSPEAVVASYDDRRADPTPEDLGFARQWELFDDIAQRTGEAPPVIESSRVLAEPREMLTALCARLGLPFDEAMLHWPAGARETDGVWAKHWYRSVERSTGFAPPSAPHPLPDRLRPVVDACRPFHDRLAAHAL